LNDQPLLNEPGVLRDNPDYQNYTEIIMYKNYEVAICDMIERSDIKNDFPELHEIIIKHFYENYDNILRRIEKNVTEDKTMTTKIYGMKINICYVNLQARLVNIYKSLIKLN
jgi:CRISPR/Cas system CSM-associated protein Csm2 small subunit